MKIPVKVAALTSFLCGTAVFSNIGVWSASTGTALVNERNTVVLRIKKPSVSRGNPDTGAAVEKQGRYAIRIADLFVKDRM